MTVVVDGAASDVLELRQTRLPVARGTSWLATKRAYGSGSAVNELVLGDDNGVVVLSPEVAEQVLAQALDSDAAEPDILARINAGESLATILAV